MREEKFRAIAEKLFVGGCDLGALLRNSFGDALRTDDWSQTPLGAVETWSDDLKAAMQILLTELDRGKPPEKTQLDSDLLQDGSASAALHQANQLNAFRVKLADALRSLTDASEIQAIAARILGESLGVTRVIYIEVVSGGEEVMVHSNYTNGVAQLSGRYRLEDYRRNLTADHQAERTQVVTDIPNHPKYTDAQKMRYREIDIAAHIDVPLIKNNQFVALLAVQQSIPRQWTETEVKLVEETAERTWAAVERAYAEAALRESEEKYRSLFKSMNDGFCIIELIYNEQQQPIDYRFLETNPAFERQSGLSDPIGKTGLYFAPNHDPELLAHYQQALVTGEPLEFEIGMADLGRHYRISANRHGDLHNKQLAIIFNDISERQQAEVALRESEERFRLMADAVPQIVWITDSEGRVEFFNKQWSDYTGVSYEPTTAEEVVANFVHPEDGDRTMEAFNEARRGGGIFSVEHRIRSAAGTYRWFLVRAEPYRDPQTGEIMRWFAASVDIHDRKQAEAIITTDLENTRLLRDLSARLVAEDNIQVLYDEIVSAAITLTRADAGSIQALDESTQELVLLATQGIDQTVTDRFQRMNPSSITSCGRVLATGKRAFVDYDAPESEDPDGTLGLHLKTGLISAQSTLLISRSGRRIGMVSTHWRKHHRPTEQELRFLDLLARQAADLIEQRQTQAERKEILEREQAAREEAERANRIKDEFLAVLSHELRSPLNPILGWTQLLQNGKLDEARRAEALKTIERNAKLQTQLIEDLLDISRIMQGKLSLRAAPVSLTFVISAAIETVRLAAEAKHIKLQLDLENTVAPISGDAVRLQQVVWNLLSNAVKFTPTGGQVTVELRQMNQLAQIRVIDTGKGINPQFLPYMFEYFRQEDGSTTRKFGGLGLGLALAQQIVQMHGGTVQAQSFGEGQGATLIVQLPAMQVAPLVSEPVQTQIDAGLPLEGIHILLVDDEPDTREFLAFLLEQSGANVTAVASGLEALQGLEQSIPDLLVSDIGMAQMDGYMLLEQIRSLPLQQGGMIPAIALTAYAAEIDQHRALQVGFQTHITKPVEPEVLVRAITVLLQPGERKAKMRL
ncbi:ATP-binding protein [Nostoc sp. FACHB-133]|uniref:ATP-binding protein n=1 Tax=Nostoc sp. FACHB-133 TaxID=2692835 RepID=UPI0016895111|nr:ATP-binding protein [Nostoc sp. FACHB-133]MBD2527624.1 PAS domain S-box protein [Nostoc sp. FACHB-133]